MPAKGQGSVSIGFQQVLVDERTDDHGNREPVGKVDYHTLHLNLDYGFANRWAVSIGLPFGKNRATGTDHDPRIFSDPHGQHFIDDGRFHAGWKDWNVALRYQWKVAPFLVTPYLKYSFPSHDYQYYGESALGLHQTELQLGINLGGRLRAPRQNFYWIADGAYSWMQAKGGRRVNHATFDLDVGYFFSPRFSAHAGFRCRQSYGGLEFPAALFDADGNLIEDVLFHHDTLRNIRYTEARVGIGYQFNDRWLLTADAGRTIHGENANLIKSAVSIGISRSF